MSSSVHHHGSPFFLSAAATLCCAIVFAGATRSGFLGDTIVQLCAVPVFLMALALTWRERKEHGWLLGWAAALLIIGLAQLIPLPFSIWTALPFGNDIQNIHSAAGMTNEWRPLSVSPHDTWISLLSLLPPAAIFFSTLHLSDREKTRLLQIVVGLAALSCVLGLWQVATILGYNEASAKPTSVDPTGLFLNRNHFSALLYVTLVVAAAFMIDGWREALSKPRHWGNATVFGPPALALLIVVMALALIVLARSRAGMVIAIAALLGAAFVATRPDARKLRQGALRWIIVAGAATFVFLSQYAFARIINRFAEDPLEDGRTTIAETAWAAGWSLMPFGTGLGTFVPVYKSIEEPSAALMGVYVNHAHNDLIEVWMETGIPGLVMLAFALVWLARRLIVLFWSDPSLWHPRGHLLSSAVGIFVVLLLAHSLVDYPLRTGALACVFALGCGILARPIGFGESWAAVPLAERHEPDQPVPAPEPRSGEFRTFDMSDRVVPADWAANVRDGNEPPAQKTGGRDLVASGEANWETEAIASNRVKPQIGQSEGWPEAWRPQTAPPPKKK